MSFRAEIKRIRQSIFLTQMDFAKEINVAFSTVNRWESGKSKPSIGAMKSLKQFCILNNIDFSNIEKEWLDYKAEEK